jgi:hypothetical protein
MPSATWHAWNMTAAIAAQAIRSRNVAIERLASEVRQLKIENERLRRELLDADDAIKLHSEAAMVAAGIFNVPVKK